MVVRDRMMQLLNSFRRRAAQAALLALAGVSAANGQVPTGFQEYHVLGHEQHVYDMNNRPVLGQAFVGYTLSGGMRSIVAATASSDTQIIYYDQWEDGFEPDLLNPTQPSTLVFGNADSTDGRACDFIPTLACIGNPAVDDTIARGDTLNLSSTTIPSGNPAAPNCAGGGNLPTNCVPIPRTAADVRFDGGDRLISSGGPVTLVHVQEPTANLGGVLGGAVEVLPLQALRNATSYSVPVGQDTFTQFGGTNTAGMPFRFVDLNLLAFEDGTAVQVSSPGAGTVSFVLNRGQHWTSRGAIDLGPAPALTINAGTKVSVNKPVAGLVFASSTGFYATRSYALLPDLLHSNDYVITAPGDNAAVNGNSIHDLYVYNPSPTRTIAVTSTDSIGTNTFNVPPNSVVPYSTVAKAQPPANRAIPNGSTVRLTSPGNFWGITAYDSRNTAFDWGHSWLATDFLTNDYAIPIAPDNPNRTVSPPAAAAPPGAAGSGATPAYVAATADNTCVRVDFDNDAVFDQIRRANGTLVPFAGPGCTDGYVINALESLRIFDNNAADGTLNNDLSGARVVSNKPVAMSYGVDSDASPISGPGLLDLGYAIYPVDQRFLNPVLTLDKTADVSSVPANPPPGQGTLITYRLEVRAFEFAPLTNLTVTDLLPPQISTGACVDAAGPGQGYVCNSTTITYPDLSTETGADAEPLFAAGPPRDELTWDASVFAPEPDVLARNETLVIEYQVRVEGGGSTVLRNDAMASAALGGSEFFTPTDSAEVVRTDVSLAKSVADDGTPAAGELLTYTLTVTNTSLSATETAVTITDFIPANTTYEPGTVNSPAPFVGVFDPGQNAVVWTAPSLAPGASAVLTFQVRVNPLALAGTVISNNGIYESIETATFPSNTVTTTLVGPDLSNITKTAVGNPAVLHPGETATFEIVVRNTGAAQASNILVTDLIPSTATYVANSLQWKLNAGPFLPLTDANDGVEGGPDGADGRAVDTGGPPDVDQVELRRATLGPGEDLTLRFRVTVNPGTGGQTLSNFATVQADNFPAVDSLLLQIPIDGDATITGHVFLDVNDNGTQDPGEPSLPNVDVVVTDEDGGVQRVSTDVNGDYTVVVPADNGGPGGGLTTLDVDETDPDFPAGATLCTAAPPPPDGCTDPQNVVAVSGATVAALNVGYVPRPLAVAKTSSAGGIVVPGDTVTYTVTVDNGSGINQDNVGVSDVLPAGVSYVPGSTLVTAPALRVTQYFVAGTPATTLDLPLNQPLVGDYFVIVRGSDGNLAGNGDRGPDENYFALTGDPAGTGDLTALGTDTLRFTRHGNVNAWTGVVSVVESLPNAGADGFTLLSVERVVHAGAGTNGADTSATPWANLGQVMLMGGYKGAGCDTTETDQDSTNSCHARLFPSGASTINWTRNGPGGTLSAATSTVMVVEWGANWTVQRARVQGNAGGDGANVPGEYNTAAIAAVARDNTWVWGTGHTNDNGAGDSGEGVLVTLGNGVAQNATETQVAAGIEFANRAVDFEVWALTHPQLAVDYRFKPDGDAGALTVDVPVDPAGASRIALAYNGLEDTGDNFPRSIFSARHLDASTVRLERRRSGGAFPAWVQSVDFTGLAETVPGGAPPVLASGFALPDGTRLTVTFQVTVDAPLAPAISSITNTATATSTQVPGGVSGSVTDAVRRLDVGVEPNSAGTLVAGPAAQTFSFTHTVTNLGSTTDSYRLAAFSAQGWRLELVDPATDVAIATDSNGDGVWDGATPNTGSLAPGATRSYRLRVTVPAATPAGVADALRLEATSDLRSRINGSALDTLVVTDGTVAGADDVLVTPDNSSSVPQPPGPGPATVAYTHTVTNLTGGTRAFQLEATSNQGFTTGIFQDTNGDGIYTPGVDTAISQTRALADNASQRIFVVVEVPPGTPVGTVDTTSVAASFFDDGGTPADPTDDTNFGGTATDTTTVTDPTDDGDNEIGFTLSGGGTRVVNAGDTALYPGELTNIGNAPDRYEFTISASVYADGLNPPPDSIQPDDGLPHTTQLVLDTNGNGVIDAGDLVVAVDVDGDGVWDLIDAAGNGSLLPPGPSGPFNDDGDATPDLAVAGGATARYELRRPVDSSQGPYSDPVTLTATSNASGNSNAVTATTSIQAATLAVIGTFVAYDAGSGATVEWRTASEHGTVGFTLERRDVESGAWLAVNARLLPALLHSRHGGVYRLEDPQSRAGQSVTYRLRELEATGATLVHGPYTVEVMHGAPPAAPAGRADRPLPGYERVARAMSALEEARIERKRSARTRAARARDERRGPVIKVGVRETGIYRVSAERIAETLGIPAFVVRWYIALNRIEVTNRGERVATLAEGDDALLFLGEAIDSSYTHENVYWLSVGQGLRMRGLDARAPAAVPGQTDTATAHAEGNRYDLTHLFDDPDDDYWMWDFRFEDLLFDFNDEDFPVATPRVAPAGVARVHVRLHGGLEARHRVRVTLQGTREVVHESEWEGLLPHSVEFEVDASALTDGVNRVRIDGLGSGDPQRPSTFYINDIDITYPRRQLAVDGAFDTPHVPGGVTSIGGFAGADVRVFDVSVPRRPRWMYRVGVDRDAEGVRVSVAPRRAPTTRILAVSPGAIRAPAWMTADNPSALATPGHRVDWLLITSSDLLDAAATLAEYRRAQGLRTLVVDVEDVYDEFSDGIRDPDAIWSLLSYAHEHWEAAPRHVVLGGEGSFDYKDYLGHGDSIIPTLLAPTPDGLFPSDNLFVDVQGNDFIPEMSIGRLPVIDAAEMQAVAEKLIAYESSGGAWTEQVVFGADASDLGGDFAASSEQVLEAVPPGLVEVETLYLDPDALPLPVARTELHRQLNEGRAFFNFFGHAGTGSIGNLNPGLLNAGDLLGAEPALANGDRLPVITAFTCLVGQFGVPGGDGLGELLLVTPDRGAAAVFSPSGLSQNRLAERLGRGFYAATYGAGELVIGDAILEAQTDYVRGGGLRYLLDIYNLLGDPATIMK